MEQLNRITDKLDHGALLNRALLRRAKGDLDGALADYTLAIAINPEHAESYLNRGVCRLLQFKDAEADQDFETCLKLKPDLKDTVATETAAAKKNRDKK